MPGCKPIIKVTLNKKQIYRGTEAEVLINRNLYYDFCGEYLKLVIPTSVELLDFLQQQSGTLRVYVSKRYGSGSNRVFTTTRWKLSESITLTAGHKSWEAVITGYNEIPIEPNIRRAS